MSSVSDDFFFLLKRDGYYTTPGEKVETLVFFFIFRLYLNGRTLRVRTFGKKKKLRL